MKSLGMAGVMVVLVAGALYSPVLTQQEKLGLRAALDGGPMSFADWVGETVAVRLPAAAITRGRAPNAPVGAATNALVRRRWGRGPSPSTSAAGALSMTSAGAVEGPGGSASLSKTSPPPMPAGSNPPGSPANGTDPAPTAGAPPAASATPRVGQTSTPTPLTIPTATATREPRPSPTAVPTPVQTATPVPPIVPVPVGGEAQALLVEMNAARGRSGLPPLACTAVLQSIAQRHSVDLAASGGLSHTGSDGRGLAQRLADGGARFGTAGENVGMARGGPDGMPELARAFLNSPPHRDNILNPAFTACGIGVVAANGVTWVTVVFADVPGNITRAARLSPSQASRTRR